MTDNSLPITVSVIVCTHNPRCDYLRRTLDALKGQTLPKDRWELLIVDNASSDRVADLCDVSWHGRAKHVREDSLGLTAARLRGIAEASGELLVFVDDDNLLAPDYLEEALTTLGRHPYLGAFGAGTLVPEFEVPPPPEIRRWFPMLALRTVPSARWSYNARDDESIPWGAGLCVCRRVADSYQPFVESLGIMSVLGRKGQELFCGEDNLFSWVASSVGCGFGIFPQLRLTHLIPAGRLNQNYVLRLIHDHAFTHGVLRFTLAGTRPTHVAWTRPLRLLLHAAKNGRFSMHCQWAASRGADSAARFILEKRLKPRGAQ